MNSKTERTGNCLCGAIQIRTGFQNNELGACHCAMCRKWGGGPVFEIECEADVIFEGEENIGVYNSSAHGERGFCKVCGTHLFVKDIASGAYGVPPGLFEDDQGIQFTRQVFIDQKPAYYSFSESTQNITSTYIHEHYPETREDT